jgi:Zn-dependent membrane protease YugP
MFMLSPLYLILVGPTLIFALYASAKTKSAFTKYSKVGSVSGITGAEAAAGMLRATGVTVVSSEQEAKATDNAVAIVPTRGFLSDHYDPRARVLRLSQDVYSGQSIASIGVACHEAGHALQHAEGYAPLSFRTAIVPLASFGSNLGVWLVFLGMILGMSGLGHIMMQVGVVLFSFAVIFTLVTLPVEYNASSRAKVAISKYGFTRSQAEDKGVATVLDAAALTYVAAALSAIMTLLYYVMLLSGNRSRN